MGAVVQRRMPALPAPSDTHEAVAKRLWAAVPEPLRGEHVMDLVDEAARLKIDLQQGRTKTRIVDGELVETVEPATAADRAHFARLLAELGITPAARVRMARTLSQLEADAQKCRFDEVLDGPV